MVYALIRSVYDNCSVLARIFGDNQSLAVGWVAGWVGVGWFPSGNNTTLSEDWMFLSLTAYTLLSFSKLPVPSVVCVYPSLFVVEYLATQTGGATVNNIFEVRFTYTKMD